MPVSDANPFFQEFEATFETHSVGMRIRKTHDIPVVHELVSTPSGDVSPAALAGVPPTAVLVGVEGERTLGLGYEEAIGRISGRGRPITLAFRQLHAAIDPGEAKRYWQGYLRLKTGDSIWTGLFYVLREDGSFLSYPSKDIEGHTPVKAVRVGSDCAVIHGESLKQFLGGDAAVFAHSGAAGSGTMAHGGVAVGGAGGSGDRGGVGGGAGVSGAGSHAWWLECFAVLAPDGIQLFRAPTPSARLDWVTALAIAATADDLGLTLSGARGSTILDDPPKHDSKDDGLSDTPSRRSGGNGDDRDRCGAAGRASFAVRRAWGFEHPNKEACFTIGSGVEKDNPWGDGETVAVGGVGGILGNGEGGGRGPAPRTVMQGFLRKRGAGRLWGVPEEWSYRWVVLRDDGRLSWYLTVPADSCEVPNGHLLLRGARVSYSEGDLLRGGLREDEIKGSDMFPLMLGVDANQTEPVVDGKRQNGPRGERNDSALQHQQQQRQQEGRRRVLFLSTWGTEEREEWADALSRYALGREPRLELGHELRMRAESRRLKGLERVLRKPEEVLTRPHEAFALLVGARGGGGGGVTRVEFCESAAQYLLPMCDVYTAGAVFDALCPNRLDVPDNAGPSSPQMLEELLDLIGEGTEAGGADGVRTGRVAAEALGGRGGGARLTFDVFRRYAEALSRAFNPSHGHPSWEDLRLRLDLHPMEVLLMGEEFVVEASRTSSQLDLMALAGGAGSLFLTDRHIFLHVSKRQQVRVVPLGSVKGVRASSSRAGPFTVDDAIELIGCEVHTVPLGTNRDEAAGKEAADAAAAAVAAAAAASATVDNDPQNDGQVPSTLRGANAAVVVGGAHGASGARKGGDGHGERRIDADGDEEKHRVANGNTGDGVGDGAGGGGGGVGGEEGVGQEDEREEERGNTFRLVLTKVKINRLVSGPEDGGGTRQKWLDCLREMVKAHHLAFEPPEQPLIVAEQRTSIDHRSGADARENRGGQNERRNNSPLPSSSLSAGTSAAQKGDNLRIGTRQRRSRNLSSDSTIGSEGGGGVGAGGRGHSPATPGFGREIKPPGVLQSLSRGTGGGNGKAGQAVGVGLRRVVKKTRALVRDRSPSRFTLEALEVDEARLRLWAAANIVRSRALSKVTDPALRPLLFCSSTHIPNRNKILDAFLTNTDSNVTNLGCSSSGGSGGVEMVMRARPWLVTIARFMAKPREFERKRAASIRAFTPQKFRQEWELFWELLDPIADAFDTKVAELLEWKYPLKSFVVMTALLLVGYHDLVRYAIPLALLGNVAYIYAIGVAARSSVGFSSKHPQGGADSGTRHARRPSANGPVGALDTSGAAATSTGAESIANAGRSPTSVTVRTTTISTTNTTKRSAKLSTSTDTSPTLTSASSISVSSEITNNKKSRRDKGRNAGSMVADGGISSRSAYTSNPAGVAGAAGHGWVGGGGGVIITPPTVPSMTSSASASSRGGGSHTVALGALAEGSNDERDTPAAGGAEDVNGPSQQEQPHQQQHHEGLLSRVKGMQNRAGKTQAKLHTYNARLLKVKSLHSWSDPGRTRAWIAAVSFVAAVLAIVPARYTFSAVVLFLFTEPIRPKGKTLPELLFQDFWAGLPVESATHTNVRMAAIYARHKPVAIRAKIGHGRRNGHGGAHGYKSSTSYGSKHKAD